MNAKDRRLLTLLALVWFYATGHWISGTVLLVIVLLAMWVQVDDYLNS